MTDGRFTIRQDSNCTTLENHVHALAIYFMRHNFVRTHQTFKVTPAMAAGVTSTFWEISDVVKVLEDWEDAAIGSKLTDGICIIRKKVGKKVLRGCFRL